MPTRVRLFPFHHSFVSTPPRWRKLCRCPALPSSPRDLAGVAVSEPSPVARGGYHG